MSKELYIPSLEAVDDLGRLASSQEVTKEEEAVTIAEIYKVKKERSEIHDKIHNISENLNVL